MHIDVETCVVTGELVCDIFGSSLQYTSVDNHYMCCRGGEASLTTWTPHTAIPEVGGRSSESVVEVFVEYYSCMDK